MNEEKAEYTVGEMQAAIDEDKKRRVQEFVTLLQHEAQRLRVDVQAVPGVSEDGRIIAQVRFVAR